MKLLGPLLLIASCSAETTTLHDLTNRRSRRLNHKDGQSPRRQLQRNSAGLGYSYGGGGDSTGFDSNWLNNLFGDHFAGGGGGGGGGGNWWGGSYDTFGGGGGDR